MRTLAIPLTLIALFVAAAAPVEAQNARATVTVELAADELEVEPNGGASAGGGAGAGNDTGNGTGNASGGGNVSGGASAANSVSFEVTVQAGGFLCAAPSTYEVALTASGGPNGVTPTVEPSTMTFNVTTNVYPGQTYSESQSGTLFLDVGPSASNGTGEVVVTASVSSGECTPSSPAATGEDSINVTVGDSGAGNASLGGNTSLGGDGNLTGNLSGNLSDDGENVSAKGGGKGDGGGIPGFEGAFVVLAVTLAVAAVALRRRRDRA